MPTTPTWSTDHKVLTCTPVSALPANHMIVWAVVDGRSAGGVDLTGTTGGFFTTAAAGTGCDPSAPMPSFTVSKGWMYEQNSAALPSLNPSSPYCFLACMTLPCPRNATNVSLRTPVPNTANMVLSSIPGHLTLPDCFADSSQCDNIYPTGDYTFTIQAASSNQQVTVNYASALTQPPAPHVNNYMAAQSIDPGQPFLLGWDALPAADGVADCVYVEIYGGVFHTPTVGEPGALNRSATSVVIPAGTLQANQAYSGCVSFYYYRLVTNGTTSVSLTYRSSTTEFSLQTTGGGGSSLVITNAGWTNGNTFVFEVLCSSNQIPLIAECLTNVISADWRPVATNTIPTQRARFTDPKAATQRSLFYRVRTGS